MFVFGQLFLAAILFSFPLGYFFGAWWYVGGVVYLCTANVLTFFAWRKARDAYLKTASCDLGENGFKVRENMRLVFNKDKPHILLLCMMVACAPAAGAAITLSLMGNKFLLKKIISRKKEKFYNTFEEKVTLLWLKDLRDNGPFRTKL